MDDKIMPTKLYQLQTNHLNSITLSNKYSV